MRKIVLHDFGGPEVLVVRDEPEPEPPADGYVVQIRAAGINFADVVERRGRYRKDQRTPYEVGKEAAGVIVAKGPEARGFELGERVIVIEFGGGCYAERVAVGPTRLLRGPADYSFEELASFAIAFGTAWYAMHEIARVRPGEAVLIQAAAGAVGTAAVALARSHGCVPILGTAGGDEKCGWVEEHGADRCVNYRTHDFREAVLEATDGRGVDYVLESVGGEVLERSLEVLAPMGRIVIIGFSSVLSDYSHKLERIHPLTVFHRSIAYAGLNVENLDFPARTGVWERLVAHVEERSLRPIVGATFPLEQAPAAHTALEGRRTHGKVLLLP